MSDFKAKETLDITSDTCPITFAKTILKLEEMREGEVLEVFLNGGEPIRSVPDSVAREGHKILAKEKVGDIYRLLVQRGPDL